MVTHNPVELLEGERIDDLLTESQLRIIQSREVFSFSLDAVLLARFARFPKNGRAADFCSGNGVIALLSTDKTDAHIDAIEIQPRVAEIARRNVIMNGLEERITVIEADLKEYALTAGNGIYDVITVNPPYMKSAAGDTNINEHYAIARHEIYCNIEDIAKASVKLLRPGGKLFMVHRPSRLVDITEALRKWKIEPKVIQFVHSNINSEANMVLIEATRDGKPDIRVLPPQIVYNEAGEQVI
ncbi:MAG: tRNA1(Val) (adenine(37)-N6)-methyltransferase [Candidatus Pristimantibacillus lignocellulolyticus]|uniref:tRNA1(Val) (Adenine(37)-N6)-methyltransferase n=1 Tax=Candidatus Pristimantibacillus lignocellulolyticus TaxID=2994561 RepID=A0A9J6ZIF4_9BACL|nr:MAG: tRNA1(Val) (adenine(37)-N6)-methyltransferase [Candidatus Pristimantibacillus lignocellulolyticus]